DLPGIWLSVLLDSSYALIEAGKALETGGPVLRWTSAKRDRRASGAVDAIVTLCVPATSGLEQGWLAVKVGTPDRIGKCHSAVSYPFQAVHVKMTRGGIRRVSRPPVEL